MLSPAPSPAPLPPYLEPSILSSDDSDELSMFRYYPILLIVVAILFFVTEGVKPSTFDQHRRLIREHERNMRRQQQRNPQPRPPPPFPPGELASVACTYRIEKTTTLASGNGHNSDCVICLEDFKLGDECQLFLSCNHGFHKACIDQWLALDRHCPLCRGSVRGVPATNIDQV